MALVKTSRIKPADRKRQAPEPVIPSVPAVAPLRNKPQLARTRSTDGNRQERIAERIAAATEELASGLTEASAAAEELRRAMEQIAAGAEEAAGGVQQQLAAVKIMVDNLATARTQADAARRNALAVETVLAETTGLITSSVRAIERNAERQEASVPIIGELERRAQDISEITQTVSRISDQTNLLALNAAIEAARAGDQGRGFAVVAEEVRALAETSEKSAREVQDLAASIQTDVRAVVAAIRRSVEVAVAEASSGVAVVQQLDTIRGDMRHLAAGGESTLTAALEAERAALETQRGVEQISSAAEQQSAAATEVQNTIQQQAKSLEQGQVAAQSLATLALSLGTVGSDAAAEQIASMSEELSATIQELSSAATEIMAAVEQINRGTQQQASATQQTSAALARIEVMAHTARDTAIGASERIGVLEDTLKSSRAAVERMMNGVTEGAAATSGNLKQVAGLEATGRRIEKIVDGIALVAVQTTMLAVSGSVEAARAGNAGRGFALVSADIRSLARDAAASADSVKDTVRGILDQIVTLRRDSEQFIASAEVEIQTNRGVFTALQRLDGDVLAMRTANDAIQQGADAIVTSAAESASGARQIAAAADEASAAARQSAVAAAQQAQGAEDLAAAIEDIASLAEELKQQDA